ncbi:MAG: 2-hydroxyglutaryl-CoA dehydratase [Deltaproteobacteria bacterium]|nr:2-hydroxyglutaryl-CoA dehydratase [Deltaproteobacteria bacterium]MBW1816471.1 2-hydroxyglutaryl-CoA dehydratase [Deltaproteobacteria bacterium]
MHTLGIDIGSASSKAVIVGMDGIVAQAIIETGPESRGSAEAVISMVLAEADMKPDQMAFVIATGYGRINVPFADEIITEIACHAKGVHYLFPDARTVLDMGGQDCKAIRVGPDGSHINFSMNDKCAAGTGRFLEIMSVQLAVPLDQIGRLSLQADQDAKISNVCTVFARTEVSRQLRRGQSKANILGGVHAATADRSYSLLKRVGIEADFVISGGIAKNIGVVRRVEDRVGLPAHISEEPQIIGALGAAIFARERVQTQS